MALCTCVVLLTSDSKSKWEQADKNIILGTKIIIISLMWARVVSFNRYPHRQLTEVIICELV